MCVCVQKKSSQGLDRLQHLSHAPSPFVSDRVLLTLPGLDSNLWPVCLCLPRSWNSRPHAVLPCMAPTMFSFSLLFFFCGTGSWTQGLALTRQALYHLSYALNPLYFISWKGFHFYAGLSWTTSFLFGRPKAATLPSFYGLRWDLANFLFQADLKPWSPVSDSQVARITDMSHCAWLQWWFCNYMVFFPDTEVRSESNITFSYHVSFLFYNNFLVFLCLSWHWLFFKNIDQSFYKMSYITFKTKCLICSF
jgi:hypothetical protein